MLSSWLFKDNFSFSFEEEKSNYQKNICNLQSILDSEREKSGSIGEQRLKLQQENEQLQKEIESLRKLATEAQQKAKIKVWFCNTVINGKYSNDSRVTKS